MTHHNQRGFALLAVFLMAAMIALMLYAQLARLAFENEREKEQLLIDRGEQFVLAIRRFTRDYGRFPASLQELEETNRKRYLRRMYVDPYTGKSEWRLIHSNGAQLTDSLVEKPPLASSSGSGTMDQNQQPQVNAAVLQRSSDQTLPGNETFLQNPGQNPAQPPGGVQIGNPQLVTPFPGQQATALPEQPPVQQQGKAPGPQFQPQFPGQQFVGQQFPGQPPPPGFQIGPNGQLIPVAPGGPDFGAPVFTFTTPQPPQSQPAQSGQQQKSGAAAALPASNPAAQNIVNSLLTSASRPPLSNASTAANSVVAGIAGVASLHTGPTIKVYNDRTRYEEWEFVYQPTTPLTGSPPGGPGGAPGQADPRAKGGTADPVSKGGFPGGRPPPPPTPPGGAFPGGFPGGGLPGVMGGPGRGGQIPIQLGAPPAGRR